MFRPLQLVFGWFLVMVLSFSSAMINSLQSKTSVAGSYAQFLESNTFVFKLADVTIFSDPVMGQLDFGIPFIYRGNKRFLDDKVELDIAAQKCDLVLISQGFDDHAHTPTLRQLSKLRPDMEYVCPPSALSILKNCKIPENKITTLLPGQKHQVTKGDTSVEILATEGALLGPPWAQKENGYILRPTKKSRKQFPSLYYEPHCMFDENELKRAGNVDYVVTPVVSQKLPAYTLVDGGEKAIRLASTLGAKCIIPMMNGELIQKGILASIVKKEGTLEEFSKLLIEVTKKTLGMKRPIKVVSEAAGVPIKLV